MTYVDLWQYLEEFYLEWEVFQIRVVEKIKTRLCPKTSAPKSCHARGYVEKYGTAEETTEDNLAYVLCTLDN